MSALVTQSSLLYCSNPPWSVLSNAEVMTVEHDTKDKKQCALSPKLDSDHGDRAWEVKLTKGKGRGIFALRDIKKGSQILVEKPLFSVQLPQIVPGKGYDMAAMVEDVAQQYSLLDLQDREEFDSCHEHRLEGDGQDDSDRLMAILRSNGYVTQDSDGRSRVAMYPQVALINHSCEPNVLNADSEIRKVIAIRDIKAGEEASIACLIFPKEFCCD